MDLQDTKVGNDPFYKTRKQTIIQNTGHNSRHSSVPTAYKSKQSSVLQHMKIVNQQFYRTQREAVTGSTGHKERQSLVLQDTRRGNHWFCKSVDAVSSRKDGFNGNLHPRVA